MPNQQIQMAQSLTGETIPLPVHTRAQKITISTSSTSVTLRPDTRAISLRANVEITATGTAIGPNSTLFLPAGASQDLLCPTVGGTLSVFGSSSGILSVIEYA